MNPVILFIIAGGAAFLAMVVLVVWAVRARAGRADRRVSPYVDALHRLLDGDEDGALERLKAAIKEEPENVDAYLRLGDLLRKRGHLEKALQLHHYLTVRRGLSPSLERAIRRSLAYDYVELERPQKAIAVLTELTSRFDGDLEAHELLLRLYESERRWEDAFREEQNILRARKEKSPERLALYHAYVACEELGSGNLDAAERNCKKALRIHRGCVPALLYLGDVHYSRGDARDAVQTWRRIVNDVPQFAHVTFGRLEQAYFDQGQFGEMMEIYDAVLKKDPGNVRALLAKAKIHERKGEEEIALDVLRRALELQPHSLGGLVALLELYIRMGNIRSATTQAQTLVELFQGDDDSYECSSCGYRVSEALWRCPNCREWETFLSPSS